MKRSGSSFVAALETTLVLPSATNTHTDTGNVGVGVGVGVGVDTNPQSAPRVSSGPPPCSLLRGVSNRIARDLQDQMNVGITNFLPHSLLFRRLEAIEKELDLLLLERHSTFQEYSKMGQATNVSKKLRITVFNTFDNTEPVYCTSEQERVHRLIEPPNWTLRIEGGLVNDVKDEDFLQGAPKFSHFVKSLYIELDRETYPDNWSIEWNKSQFTGETDGFEFKRIGDTETIVNIFLILDYHGKFKVVPPLAQELNLSQGVYSKAHVLHALWKYIRERPSLKDSTNPQKVNCNTNLKNIFKKDSFLYSEMPQLLAQYLVPPGPIQIQHEIQVRGPLMESTYEIPFDLPSLNPMPISKEIEAIDQKIHDLMKEFSEHQLKRRFLLELSEDPIGVMENYITDHIREQQIKQTGRDHEAERKTLFYLTPIDHLLDSYLQNTKNL